jgi:hypothetical protein
LRVDYRRIKNKNEVSIILGIQRVKPNTRPELTMAWRRLDTYQSIAVFIQDLTGAPEALFKAISLPARQARPQ